MARNRAAPRGGFSRICNELLAEFARRRPIRAGSLVISLFGDAIEPRGGSVWLGSLIRALEPFGISERLVRTSVFRLADQGWLMSERIGRRSYYRLTSMGVRRFQEASRRIYSEPRQQWSGSWCLALIGEVQPTVREEIRRQLGWQGFGSFSSNVLAHPAPNTAEVTECLADIEGADRVLLLDARAQDSNAEVLRELVNKSWQLDELEHRYQMFLERFRPLFVAARDENGIAPEGAFCSRVLLIHEYRRILLRDPSLPGSLLPQRWDGVSSYQLCRNLYVHLAPPAEQYLTENIENAYGPLPPADDRFLDRFGGIDPATGETA